MSEAENSEKITLYFSTVPGNHEVIIFVYCYIAHFDEQNQILMNVVICIFALLGNCINLFEDFHYVNKKRALYLA